MRKDTSRIGKPKYFTIMLVAILVGFVGDKIGITFEDVLEVTRAEAVLDYRESRSAKAQRTAEAQTMEKSAKKYSKHLQKMYKLSKPRLAREKYNKIKQLNRR